MLPRPLRLALSRESELKDEQPLIVAHLVRTLEREARERGHELFFLLFHDHPSLADGCEPSWQEEHLLRHLAAAGVPWCDTRAPLCAAAATRGGLPSDFYRLAGPGRNQLNADGHAVAFDALLAGLKGEVARADER